MKEREKFGSRLGFILVSAGCAIGIGNVWKFPYITGIYGGAAFILMYLVFLVALGLPIMVCEFTVGRGSRMGMGKALDTLEPKGTKWHRMKWISIFGSFLLMMFYTMVGGWMLKYAFMEATGTFVGLDGKAVEGVFGDMLTNPGTLTFWAIVAIVISFGACGFGLQKGIEKVTKVMMIALLLLMIALAVNSAFLPNAAAGIKFYLVPDFGEVAKKGFGNAVFAAMSQAFFTLSIGIGSMEIFGSYMSDANRLPGEAVRICCLDTFVAFMSGLIIFPACFSYGVDVKSGPALIFVTLPNVFNNLPAGRFWGSLFFLFMTFAAYSTVLAVFENIVSCVSELTGLSRKKTCLVCGIALFLLSLPCLLGYNLWSNFRPIAGRDVLDSEDFLVSNLLLPLGSLLFIIFCTTRYGWGWENFLAEANEGKGLKIAKWLRPYMTYVLPVIVGIILIFGLYNFFAA